MTTKLDMKKAYDRKSGPTSRNVLDMKKAYDSKSGPTSGNV